MCGQEAQSDVKQNALHHRLTILWTPGPENISFENETKQDAFPKTCCITVAHDGHMICISWNPYIVLHWAKSNSCLRTPSNTKSPGTLASMLLSLANEDCRSWAHTKNEWNETMTLLTNLVSWSSCMSRSVESHPLSISTLPSPIFKLQLTSTLHVCGTVPVLCAVQRHAYPAVWRYRIQFGWACHQA